MRREFHHQVDQPIEVFFPEIEVAHVNVEWLSVRSVDVFVVDQFHRHGMDVAEKLSDLVENVLLRFSLVEEVASEYLVIQLFQLVSDNQQLLNARSSRYNVCFH